MTEPATWWALPDPPPREVTTLLSGADGSLWHRHEGEWWRKHEPVPAAVKSWPALLRHYGPLKDVTASRRRATEPGEEFEVGPDDCERGRWNPDNGQCLDCGHISPGD